MSSWDNKGAVLAFLCNWAPYRCFMDLGNSEPSLPPKIYPIKVMCAGRVDPAMVLSAFEKGAEGVMLIGCRDKECRHGQGPEQAGKTEERFRGLMHVLGLESERFARVTVAPNEKERLFEEMDQFARRIAGLGKSPLGQ